MAADRIVSLCVAGRVYRLPEPEEITSDECAELERLSGQCCKTFLRSLGRLNPDTWREWNDEIQNPPLDQLELMNDAIGRFKRNNTTLIPVISDVSDTLQRVYDAKGIEGLATSIGRIKGPINDVQVATLAWTEATGRVPDLVEVQALFNDPEARAAIETYVGKIAGIPANSETKAELLAEAAKQLAGELRDAILDIPDDHKTDVTVPGAVDSSGKAEELQDALDPIMDNHKTDVTVPGAVDSKNKADDVGGAVRGIPDNSRTNVRVDGAENAVNAADRVADHIRNIPTTWGTTISSRRSRSRSNP